MRPLVSVVMTAYNAEKYIAEAIQSILDQTYKNLELIIVNDGSTDRTLEIINSFDDNRIRLVNNERNLGAAESSNKGIEIVQGKYIARMDADDISYPNRIEKQVNFLEQHEDIHVVGTFLKVVYEDTDEPDIVWKYSIDPKIIRSALIFNPGVAHATLMFRREVFNTVKYDTSLCSAIDYDLYCRLSRNIKFSNIPEILYIYRRHKNQMSTGINSKQQKNAKKIRLKMLQNMGVVPTESELELHQEISNGIINNFSLSEIIFWLEKLVYMNDTTKFFPTEEFKEVIANKLYSLIVNSDIFNEHDLKRYYFSFLSDGRKLPESSLNVKGVINFLYRKNFSRVAIFGTKRVGLFVEQQLTSNGITVKCFLDNSKQKQGLRINNLTVESPQWLLDNMHNIDAVLVTVLGHHSKEIVNSLAKLTNNNVQIISWDQLIKINADGSVK